MTALAAVRRPIPGSQLLGFGAAQPAGGTSAHELGSPFGKSADWIRTRTGIESVRRMASPASLAALAHDAAADALAAAGIDRDDVDLVLLASCSSGAPRATTTSIAEGIAPRAPTIHLNAACSGFCYALQAADDQIRTGAARHVLVVAAENMSGMLDTADLGTSIIFGDGAGAAVLGKAELGRPGVGPTVSGSDGARWRLIHQEHQPGSYLRMEGREVFRWAIEQVPVVVREACRRAGVDVADIDVFVPHQANLRIIDGVTRALGLEHAVVADDIVLSGNTSAASIPIALTRLIEQERVTGGQLALLVGFGAGLTYAAQVVTLPT